MMGMAERATRIVAKSFIFLYLYATPWCHAMDRPHPRKSKPRPQLAPLEIEEPARQIRGLPTPTEPPPTLEGLLAHADYWPWHGESVPFAPRTAGHEPESCASDDYLFDWSYADDNPDIQYIPPATPGTRHLRKLIDILSHDQTQTNGRLSTVMARRAYGPHDAGTTHALLRDPFTISSALLRYLRHYHPTSCRWARPFACSLWNRSCRPEDEQEHARHIPDDVLMTLQYVATIRNGEPLPSEPPFDLRHSLIRFLLEASRMLFDRTALCSS